MMLTTSVNDRDKKKAEIDPYVSKFLNKPLDQGKLEEIDKLLE